jgi:hypothetical protein
VPSGAESADGFDFSLVRGGPLYRVQRALRLIPDDGLGVRQRILVFVALTWLPVVLGAIATGRAFGAEIGEPLWQHFGVHARGLVGIPLLLVAEGIADRLVPALLRYFVTSGLIAPSGEEPFREALHAAARLRDSRWGALFVIGVALIATAGNLSAPLLAHEVAWAVTPSAAGERVGLAGLWYLFISRPLILLLLLTWLWRIVVLYALFQRIAQLDLQLVPSHPDRAAGLGFFDHVPLLMTPVALALSAVLASQLAHEVLYHGVHVDTLRPVAAAWLIVALVIFLLPLFPFCWQLTRMRRSARLRYGDLLGQHGRLFEARWLTGSRSDESLLGAQDISAATDAIALYGAVESLRTVPFGLRGVAPLAAAVLLPLVPVFAIEIPIKDLLLRILKGLI